MASLTSLAARKASFFEALILICSPVSRVAAQTGGTLLDLENAKAGDANLVALLEVLYDEVNEVGQQFAQSPSWTSHAFRQALLPSWTGQPSVLFRQPFFSPLPNRMVKRYRSL